MKYGEVDLMPIGACIGNYSVEEQEIGALRMVGESAILAGENYTEMVVISPSFYGLTSKTVVSFHLLCKRLEPPY